MDSTKEIKTSNGFVATLKSFLTFGEYNRIQQAITSSINFNKDAQVDNIKGDFLLAAQEVTLQILLLKLINPNGNVLETPEKAINDIPVTDGKEIMEAINAITNEAKLDKKKEI